MSTICSEKSGTMPGGIKHILREDNLSELENLIDINASPIISFLISVRKLHFLCVSNELLD